jgi:hypothetical protein
MRLQLANMPNDIRSNARTGLLPPKLVFAPIFIGIGAGLGAGT